MWRVFNSVTRGARTFRPSPCCSQESSDDVTQIINDHQSYQSCFDVSCRHASTSSSSSSKHAKNNLTIRICRISCCFCNHIVKWNEDHGKTHDRGKLIWIWAIPCDVYPHAQIRWNDSESRRNSHFNWSQFYQEQYSVLNAFRWGSATALAWGLCREIRNVTNVNQQNANLRKEGQNETLLSYDPAASRSAQENENGNRGSADFENAKCSSTFLPKYSILPQHQNGNTCFQPNLFNPEVNKSFFASLFNHSIDSLLVESTNSGNKRKSQRLQAVIAIEEDPLPLSDITPQIEIDKKKLGRRERRPHDSGYSERAHETSSGFPHSLDSCSLCSKDTDVATSTDTSVFKIKHESTSLHATTESSQHSFLNSLQQCGFELSSDNTSENLVKTKVKEEVLIEDCDSRDSFHNDIKSFDELSESETEASSSHSRYKTSPAGIDEFSDGLKEILEAGRKDLNDFNTQLMGVLEGDIGRSISKEEPSLAITYFRAGALLGDSSSTFNLALCYHLARGVEQDLKMARELYQAASLAGHGWATYNLAVLLFEGQGGPADSEKAQELLVKAGKLGVREAQEALKQRREIKKDDQSTKDKNVTPAHQESRQFVSTHSEPLFSSVLSNVWSSSYSTSDLDFMEDSPLQLEDFSRMTVNTVSKPKFYLE